MFFLCKQSRRNLGKRYGMGYLWGLSPVFVLILVRNGPYRLLKRPGLYDMSATSLCWLDQAGWPGLVNTDSVYTVLWTLWQVHVSEYQHLYLNTVTFIWFIWFVFTHNSRIFHLYSSSIYLNTNIWWNIYTFCLQLLLMIIIINTIIWTLVQHYLSTCTFIWTLWYLL